MYGKPLNDKVVGKGFRHGDMDHMEEDTYSNSENPVCFPIDTVP